MSMNKPEGTHEVAIDPLALLLRNDIYVKLHLPRPGDTDIAKINEAVGKMSPAERATVLENAKAMKAHAQKIVESIEKNK